MTARLDGPRIAPRGNVAKQLVVFLHGYGADGNDLIEIGRQWQTVMPEAAFVAPHAPERTIQSPTGRQWFPLTTRGTDERWRGATEARPTLDAFLDAELARNGLDDGAMALVGFSQGTMMALHVGLRRPRAPAAVLGFSGLLVGPERIAEATASPPVLLVHGEDDQVIPVDAMFEAADALGEAGIGCEWHLSMRVGHGIDGEGLRHGALFLMRRFGLRLPPQRRPPGA